MTAPEEAIPSPEVALRQLLRAVLPDVLTATHRTFPPLQYIRVLTILWRANKPLLVKQIGTEVGVTTSNASLLVNGLASYEYVKRVPGERDRRNTFIVLTAKGERVIRDLTPDMLQHLRIVSWSSAEQARHVCAWLNSIGVPVPPPPAQTSPEEGLRIGGKPVSRSKRFAELLKPDGPREGWAQLTSED